MLRVAELLPASNFPKPSDALPLQWYYMSYHKSDHEKYVLGRKTLKDATFESVTDFFQVLYEQKKGDGLLERQEVEQLRKRLLRKATEGVRRKIRGDANDRRVHRAQCELVRRDERRRYDVECGRDRRRHDDDRDNNNRRPSHGHSRGDRDERRSDRERDRRGRNNQPISRRSASAGRMKGKSGAPPCMLHSWQDRLAKHTWAECSENPANQKKPPKREQAYYAHDARRPASNGPSDDEYRTEVASEDDESSQCWKASRRSYLSRGSVDDDNYAVNLVMPQKRVKLNPPARKKREHIAASDESGGNGITGSNKKGKSKDPLYLSDSN